MYARFPLHYTTGAHRAALHRETNRPATSSICAMSKVRASQLARIAAYQHSGRQANQSAKCQRFENSIVAQEATMVKQERAPMRDAMCHAERPTDASVAPAAVSAPFECQLPG